MHSLDLTFPKLRVRSPSLTMGQWLTLGFVVCYVFISFIFFFSFVKPSLQGDNDLRIGADSSTYLWLAGVGDVSPFANFDQPPPMENVILSIGNYLGPILIAETLRSLFLIACFNYLLFFIAFNFLRKIKGVQWAPLLILLLIHPITMLSLLTLNKEIIALLGVSMLFYYVSTESSSKLFLLVMLIVSFLARWEQAVLSLYFLIMRRGFLRKRPVLLFCATAILMSIVYVWLAAHLSSNAELITGSSLEGNLIILLDDLQLHGMYFIVFLPKTMLNLYAGALNPLAWLRADWSDIYGSATYLVGGVLDLLVTLFYWVRFRKWTLQDDTALFVMYCSLFMSIAPFTNTRYVFPVYIVLALACCRTQPASSHFASVDPIAATL